MADNYLIQMFTQNKKIKKESSGFRRFGSYWYAIEFPGKHIGNGRFSVNELCEKLLEADIIEQNLKNEVYLSKRGLEFARWLIDNDYKAEAFLSPIGGWGEISQINRMGVEIFKSESSK